jgi:hypothetical protein
MRKKFLAEHFRISDSREKSAGGDVMKILQKRLPYSSERLKA